MQCMYTMLHFWSLLYLAWLALRSFPFFLNSSFLWYIELDIFQDVSLLLCYYIQCLWSNVVLILREIIFCFVCILSTFYISWVVWNLFIFLISYFLVHQITFEVLVYLPILSSHDKTQASRSRCLQILALHFISFQWSKLTLFPYLVKWEILIIKVVRIRHA